MKTIYDELKKDHQKVLSLLDHLISSENAAPESTSGARTRVAYDRASEIALSTSAGAPGIGASATLTA